MKNRGNTLFSFKQFQISDSDCAMKIGTDAVLLGSLAAQQKSTRVMDIGTGCGIISLMIAQKSPAEIHAVEIDHKASIQAAHNFATSPWADRLKVFQCPIQQFIPQDQIPYDLIVCNPPYFQNSLKNNIVEKAIARHNQTLSYEEIFTWSRNWLTSDGKLMMIYPIVQDECICEKAADFHLFTSRRTIISPNPETLPNRVITWFRTKQHDIIIQEDLCIETSVRHIYTNQYKELTRDYHPFL